MKQVIETECTACHLHESCHTVGMNGQYDSLDDESKFKIFLDYPSQEDDAKHRFGESRQARYLLWLLRRMSLKEEEYEIHYTLKCFVPKNVLKRNDQKWECIDACTKHRIANLQSPPYTIVTMGDISCLAFTGKSLKSQVSGFCRTEFGRIYVSYAPGYGVTSPSETVGISRQLWIAAEHAKLKPKVNLSIKDFNFEVI